MQNREYPMTTEGIQNESELILRFQDGDEEAFRLLFEPCRGALQARAETRLAKALRRRLSVADVLQDARITAFKCRHKLEDRGPGSFRNWLLGIVDMEANTGIQRHAGAAKRTVEREVSRNFRLDTAEYPGREPTPSQDAVGAEAADLARQAMATLSEDYRHVLKLVRIEGLSLREAAERIGRSHEAVKKLYGRALRAFTGAFDKLGGGSDA